MSAHVDEGQARGPPPGLATYNGRVGLSFFRLCSLASAMPGDGIVQVRRRHRAPDPAAVALLVQKALAVFPRRWQVSDQHAAGPVGLGLHPQVCRPSPAADRDDRYPATLDPIAFRRPSRKYCGAKQSGAGLAAKANRGLRGCFGQRRTPVDGNLAPGRYCEPAAGTSLAPSRETDNAWLVIGDAGGEVTGGWSPNSCAAARVSGSMLTSAYGGKAPLPAVTSPLARGSAVRCTASYTTSMPPNAWLT